MSTPDRDTRLERLLDEQEIRTVILRLARGTDRLDADLIRSCYHPDALDDHNAFRGGPEEFARWVQEALAHFAATMHFLGNLSIEVEGDVAHAETYCVAHHLFRPDDPGGERDLVLGLRYLDRFERRGGPWRIALRRCAFDWTYTVPVTEKWKFGDDYIVGRRNPTDPGYERP